MVAPVLIAAALSGPVFERLAVERLLGGLGELRANVKTLRVEFKLERTDAVFRRTEVFNGTFTALNDGGKFFAALRLEPRDQPDRHDTWVLRGNGLSYFNAHDKTIRKCDASNGALKYAADDWHAAFWLLDAAEARKRCTLRLLKVDEHYNYFSVTVDQPSALGLYFDRPTASEKREYRFAVTRVASKAIPAGVVSKAVVQPNGVTEVYTVTSWVRDEHKLTPKDFPDPATPPEGWTVKP